MDREMLGSDADGLVTCQIGSRDWLTDARSE